MMKMLMTAKKHTLIAVLLLSSLSLAFDATAGHVWSFESVSQFTDEFEDNGDFCDLSSNDLFIHSGVFGAVRFSINLTYEATWFDIRGSPFAI